MKKLLVIALSAIMVLAFAAVSMAAVEITGEVDASYNALDDSTLTELGLYCDAPINDVLSVYFGFWMDNTATDAALDDANATFKIGKGGELIAGYGKFDFCGLDILGDNGYFDNVFGTVEPPVSLRYIQTVAEGVTINAGYFRGKKNGEILLNGPVTLEMTGEEDDVYYAQSMTAEYESRTDLFNFGAGFEQGAFALDFNYFTYGGAAKDDDNYKDALDARYVLNASYKFGDAGKAYLLYANLPWFEATSVAYADEDGDGEDDTIVYTGEYATKGLVFVGGEYTISKFTAQLEYGITNPADSKPLGFKLTYAVNDNASILYKRSINGGGIDCDVAANTVNKLTADNINTLMMIVTF